MCVLYSKVGTCGTSLWCNYFTCNGAFTAIIFKRLCWHLRHKYSSKFEHKHNAKMIKIDCFLTNCDSSLEKTLARYIGEARFLIGGGSKPQITHNDVTKIFKKRDFLWDKDNVKWRIQSRDLGWHVIWILLKEKDLNQKFKRFLKLPK